MVPADSLFVAFGEAADLYVTGYSANAEHVADESTVLLKPVPEGALLATVARMLGTLCKLPAARPVGALAMHLPLHWANNLQARSAEPVDQVLRADARQVDICAAGQPPSPGHCLA
jgi:hypothetical protein